MRIVIITMYLYPNGDAGSVRQHSFAKIFQSLGHEVILIGNGEPTRGYSSYDGIKFISLRSGKSRAVNRVIEHITFGREAINQLRSIGNVDAILATDLLPNAFFHIVQYARKHRIILLHDSVEWYSRCEFKCGILSLSYILKECTNRIIIDREWRVIAISNYLYNYFLSRGCKTQRIPVIMDIMSIKPEYVTKGNKVSFVYAGGPGKKDYLYEMLQGFALLPIDILKKVEIHIIGVNKDQLIQMCKRNRDVLDRIGNYMHVYGRINRLAVIDCVRNAHYSMLLRDSRQRYAKAGFPTKVVESLACGTPVICNLSSDLDMYLKNSYNAIIVKSYQPEDFAAAIAEAVNIADEEYIKMRYNARFTAESNFHYEGYKLMMNDLLASSSKEEAL